MVTAVISFEDRTDNNALRQESKIISILNSSAVYVDRLIVLDVGDKDKFIKELDAGADAVFIVNRENVTFDFSAIMAEKGLNFDADGFYVADRLITLVPTNIDGYSEIALKKLSEFYGFNVGKITFKVLGKTKSQILEVTNEISQKFPSIFFNVESYALDNKVELFYSDKSTKMDVDKATKEFIIALKNNIYAEEDVTLTQRFHDLLKLRRLVCSTAESMTGGRIASKIVEVDGASDIFYEGMVTYNTLAKERRLDVSHNTVVENTVVSSQVAYEMAKGILKNADLAISITGYAGSSVSASEDDGLCFIGIGLFDKIDVYKFNFGGTRQENIDTAANMAIFLALKTVLDTDI